MYAFHFGARLVSLLGMAMLLACSGDGGEDSSATSGAMNGGNDPASSGNNGSNSSGEGSGSNDGSGNSNGSGSGTSPDPTPPPTHSGEGPAAGRAEADYPIPEEAHLVDTSSPDHVIGDGSPESCTSQAVIDAVAQGGIITFDCGDEPITIELEETAKVVNDTGPEIVIDGGGLVTLSGQHTRRILYMNTCDPEQIWTTTHCDNQDHPRLTIQNLTFVDGDSTGQLVDGGGGGAVFALGGRLKILNSRFFNNRCDDGGPDLGGGAVRALMQHNNQPVYVVNSTFGGAEGFGNVCSNGGGLSSIGVSWTIINSVLSYNEAIGCCGNPPSEPPGGGSGGAIYNDGGLMTLSIFGSLLEHNSVTTHGSAIIFISNDHTGDVQITDSIIRANTGGYWYQEPGISAHEDTPIVITDSVLEE